MGGPLADQGENSLRVSLLSRKAPSMALVMAPECCFSTPRIIMQKCRASQITPTPRGLSKILHGFGDLLRQPLLNLQAAREHVHDARNFAEADHLLVRQIGHVNLAEERQHVMLAHAEELDVLHDHDLVVFHVEERAVDDFVDDRRSSRWSGNVSAFSARSGVRIKAFAFRIFAQLANDLPHVGGDRNPLRRLARKLDHLFFRRPRAYSLLICAECRSTFVSFAYAWTMTFSERRTIEPVPAPQSNSKPLRSVSCTCTRADALQDR